jgi:hypothetical protein
MRFKLNGKIRLTEEVELTFERNIRRTEELEGAVRSDGKKISYIKNITENVNEVFMPEQKYINHIDHGICFVYTSTKHYTLGHASFKYILLCNGEEFILLDEVQSLFCFTHMWSLNDINKEIKKLDDLKFTQAGIINFINKYIFP